MKLKNFSKRKKSQQRDIQKLNDPVIKEEIRTRFEAESTRSSRQRGTRMALYKELIAIL